MRNSAFRNLVLGSLGMMALASAAPTIAVAHEAHDMECSEASMNAMNTDIQAMPDGEAKTTAMNEMKMAEEMMDKKDMQSCLAHIANAMEATEK